MPFTKETAALYGAKGGKAFKRRYGLRGLAKNGRRGAKSRWKKKRSLSTP